MLIFKFRALIIAFFLFGCSQKAVDSTSENEIANANNYVGEAACIECHQQAYNDWKGSHHDWAMKPPNDTTVLGDFSDVVFSSDGETYGFHKNDSAYFVTTKNIEGEDQVFEIAYTFGVTPLQQYLIKFPEGSYQTLRATWDTEHRKWFNQYAGQEIPSDDWLHWQQGGQRWNTMCAECHSTNLDKGYDLEKNSFNTTYSNLTVSCEACHGPGGAHVQWASATEPKGDPQVQVVGTFQTEQLNQCARCHARRVKLTNVMETGMAFDDQFMLQTINNEFYHPDGQIKEEDYVFGSFVQSKMFHKGIRCTDCHNMHSMKLKLEGNTLCMQCHEPKYNSEEHHFHKHNTESAQCVSCHMTGAVYMGNDFRRDHSFRVPRPDQSVTYKTPNACTGCHSEKSDKWAAEWITKWYGNERANHFSDYLLKASQLSNNDQARGEVLQFINDMNYPAIARATALEYFTMSGSEGEMKMLLTALGDSAALVRYNALAKLQVYPLNQRVAIALQHVKDSTRLVRIGAAQLITELDINQLEPAQRGGVISAQKELMEMLEANADFPLGRLQLGDYYFRQRNVPRAIKEYKMALKMDALLTPVYGNLATAYSIVGDNNKALKTLDQLLNLEPEYARGYYLRGLLHHEMSNDALAIRDLESSIQYDPNNFRVYYNLANLYVTTNDLVKAEKTLSIGLKLQPNSEEGLQLQTLIQSKKIEE